MRLGILLYECEAAPANVSTEGLMTSGMLYFAIVTEPQSIIGSDIPAALAKVYISAPIQKLHMPFKLGLSLEFWS